MKLLATLLSCSALATPFAGCSSSDITNPNQIVFPASNVSFHATVAPFLQLSCNQVGCHDAPRSANQGIDLTSWIGVRSNNVVLPKDTTSPLVGVMYGRYQHSGPFIANDNQRNGIKVWVLEGAQDN